MDGTAVAPAGDGGGLPADAERQSLQLLDQLPDAILVLDGGRIVYANSAAVLLIGAPADARLVAHPITEFIRPDSIPRLLDRMASLQFEGDTSEPLEAVLLRIDGTAADIEATSVLTRWEGRAACLIVIRDLHARKAAEAALTYQDALRYQVALRHQDALHRQAALMTHVSDAVIVTTSTGIVTQWNPAAEAIYQRGPAEAFAMSVSELVGAPLEPAELVAAGGVVHAIHRLPDGSLLAVRIYAEAMDDGYILICTDQAKLRLVEKHLQTVVDLLDHGVLVIGGDGQFESANPAALRILGVGADQLLGTRYRSGVALYDAKGKRMQGDRSPVAHTRRTGEPVIIDMIGVDRPDGQRVWMAGICRLLNPDDREHSSLLLSFTDITAQHVASERLTYESAHDALTGLPNRPHVLTRIADDLDSDSSVLAAVLYIDLDHLKSINDSLGHDAGDDVLRIAAQRMQHTIRPDDLLGRLGGDEFVVLVRGEVRREELDHIADRLHSALSTPVDTNGLTLQIGASVGIVALDDNDQRLPQEILRDADRAMYEAKTTGRGRSYHFTDELRDRRQGPLNG